MRTLTRFSMLLPAALVLWFVGLAQAAQSDWEQIYLEGPIETELPDGTTRTLHPSCSGGPEVTEAGLVPANTDYFFFVQEGNPNRLLIGLDGGGACWDAATCFGSPLTGNSTYTVSLDETPALFADSEGVFDSSNPRNPYKNYTKVFIPYCSADVHWGSKDTIYPLSVYPWTWTIHHRGADNFLAVLDWLQKHGRAQYRVDLDRVRDLTVTGASAGGYGAQLVFAYVAELTPRAKLNLISDSAIGVITQPCEPTSDCKTFTFYKTAIYDPDSPGSESWGVQQNLPSWVPGLNETLLSQGATSPNDFVRSLFVALADYKPNAHMATITSNLDMVQIFFYGLMKGVVPPTDVEAGEWYSAMAQMTADTAYALPKYRFLIDAGAFHTFIGSDEYVYELGANDISLADWIQEMIKPGSRHWVNLDAGPPPF